MSERGDRLGGDMLTAMAAMGRILDLLRDMRTRSVPDEAARLEKVVSWDMILWSQLATVAESLNMETVQEAAEDMARRCQDARTPEPTDKEKS